MRLVLRLFHFPLFTPHHSYHHHINPRVHSPYAHRSRIHPTFLGRRNTNVYRTLALYTRYDCNHQPSLSSPHTRGTASLVHRCISCSSHISRSSLPLELQPRKPVQCNVWHVRSSHTTQISIHPILLLQYEDQPQREYPYHILQASSQQV